MSSAINSGLNRYSDSGFLGKLAGLFLARYTKKTLAEVTKLLQAANDSEIDELELLNSHSDYRVSRLDEIEDLVNARKFLSNMLELIYRELSDSMKELSESDKLYNEIIHLKNAFYNFMETNNKVYSKLDEIHNKILTSASENMGADVLDSIWEGEEELWNNFYLESKKS